MQNDEKRNQNWVDFADPNWMDEFVIRNWHQLAQVAWEGYETLGRGWVIVDEEDYRTSIELSANSSVIDMPYSYGAPTLPEAVLSHRVNDDSTDDSYRFLIESVTEYNPEEEILVFFRGASADNYHLVRTSGSPPPRDAFMGARILH